MLARIFNWLGSMHLRGRVLFVGASNRPDLLDPALLDRFRVSIPVLKPTISEIGQLVTLLLARFERECSVETAEAARLLAPLRPSGRTLQEIIVQAGMLADAGSGETGQVLGLSNLETAAYDCLNPEDPLELEFIRLTSLSLTSAQSLLPWNGLAGLRDLADIPADLREMGVVSDDGRIIKNVLHERLRALASERQSARMMR
jgi:SpoVK/Ycf46/Vps4 family AAA+-type ATPase